jgi:hypothetical protein
MDKFVPDAIGCIDTGSAFDELFGGAVGSKGDHWKRSKAKSQKLYEKSPIAISRKGAFSGGGGN